MGNRLSKIYTRTGDDGTTGLGDGSRIEKDHTRMETIGTVDELNCQVGVLIAELTADDPLQAIFTRIQHHLFDLGGELCIPGYELIKATQNEWLEQQMDDLNEDLPALKNFILPGGSRAAAAAHLARAICRRAERCIIRLAHDHSTAESPINRQGQIYLNRLSDLLFISARLLARRDGGSEVLWQQGQ